MSQETSQQKHSDFEATETPAERERKRFVRRWTRRGRILGPFLGIPLVFGALALSMDFVKFLPQAEMARAQGRAVKTRPLVQVNRSAERRVRIPSKRSAVMRHSSAVQPGTASVNGLDPNSISLEISDTSTTEARLPSTPSRERRTR